MADSHFLLEVFERLRSRYELERWHWQANTPALDICVGAILVQHTAWTNVEKALANLRREGALSLEALARPGDDELAALLRPAGTPLTKARRLKAFAALVGRHGSLEALLSLPVAHLRSELLATNGIGPETADVIILYAASGLTQVHDAYTQRLLRRLGLGPDRDGYAAWAAWLAERLPEDVKLHKQFHSAVVLHCKEVCRVRPKCQSCAVLDLCAFGGAAAATG
jgi:endonuclease-3 related protein